MYDGFRFGFRLFFVPVFHGLKTRQSCSIAENVHFSRCPLKTEVDWAKPGGRGERLPAATGMGQTSSEPQPLEWWACSTRVSGTGRFLPGSGQT